MAQSLTKYLTENGDPEMELSQDKKKTSQGRKNAQTIIFVGLQCRLRQYFNWCKRVERLVG